MAVMTHAHTTPGRLPIAADYTALPPYIQNAFDQFMTQADNAGTDDEYATAMVMACLTIGIAVPASKNIARCDCLNDGCGCGAIFDSHLEGVVVTATNAPNGNLSQLQCPDCGHDHPRPIAD